MEPQFIKIQKFNPHSIRQNAKCLILGKRATGKTSIAKSLHFKKPGTNIIMTTDEKAPLKYASLASPEFIYKGYSEDVVEEAIAMQTRYETNYINIILDDCLQNTNYKSLSTILGNGRSLRISTTMCMSYHLIPLSIRTNIDYVFMLRETNMSDRKKLYEQYGGMFPSFNTFCSIFDICTNHYGCLVIDTQIGGVFQYSSIHYKISQILENPMFLSQLRTIGRTRRLKNELFFVTSLIPNG